MMRTMVLALLLLAAAPKVDARLVGVWQLNGQPFATLRADGTGVVDGEAVRWRVDKGTLVLTDDEGETERLPFQVTDVTLTVQSEGATLTLTKSGKAVAAQTVKVAPAPAPARQPAAPQRAGNDQLSRLLLSSNWCWIRYASGNSYTQKVHFSPDGTWQDFSESDISVNNQYAQVTAQATGNRYGGGRWAVRNGQLLLSEDASSPLEPVPFSISYNSNGYPLITADGREYSQCD